MKEAVTAFGTEVFTPIATVAIPGAFAIWAPLTWEVNSQPEVKTFIDANPAVSGVALLVLAIAAGLLLEIAGTFIEAYILDFIVRFFHSDAENNWNRYLRLAFAVEPIGERYIRSRVMILKFELGTGLALICQGLSLYAFYDSTTLFKVSGNELAIYSYVAAALLLACSVSSAFLLNRARENLLRPITVIGK